MEYWISEHHESRHHLMVVKFEAAPAEIPDRIGSAFAAVFGYLGRHRVSPAGPAVGCYEMVGPEHFVVRAGCVVPEPIEAGDGVEPYDLPEGPSLRTLHVGPYAELPKAYEALQHHAVQHHLQLDLGMMWEEYLSGPEVPNDQMHTIVHWPIVG